MIIAGVPREDWYGICVSTNSIIPKKNGKGVILSPGWPFNSVTVSKNCLLTVSTDLVSYTYSSRGEASAPDCSAGQLTVGSNTTLCSGAQ